MSTKIPAFIGYDPVNDLLFDKDGNVISKSTLWPDAVLGEKKLMNVKLSTQNDSGGYDDYEEIPAGTTFNALVDNDYDNPDYESFGNDVADWVNTTGSEYEYQTAIANEPYELVEYYTTLTKLTRGTAGSLSSGEWDYVGNTVTVRLSDDTNPSSKAENYLQYVVSSYTPLFIFAENSAFNLTNTWYDYDTGTYRDPDPQLGELTLEINANTEDYKDRLDNASFDQTTTLQIQLFEAGTAELSKMFEFNFICRNRYLKNPLSLEVVGANVYTKAEVDALLNGKMDTIPSATENNIVTFSSTGNSKNSGVDITTLTTPAASSVSFSTTGTTLDSTNVQDAIEEIDLRENSKGSTGIYSGGIISINGGDNTKFDIASGVGYVVDSYTDPANPTAKKSYMDGKKRPNSNKYRNSIGYICCIRFRHKCYTAINSFC